MADREWFIINPDPNGTPQYTNEESADRAAREAVRLGADCVTLVRCTATDVRRYRREVTVVPEDVNAFDA